MTTCTTEVVHLYVSRVIEAHRKTAQSRKGFQASRRRTRMTNRADRTAGIGELLDVAAGTRRVVRTSRHRWPRGIVLAPVTERARQTSVVCAAMAELVVVAGFRNLHLLRLHCRSRCESDQC